MYTGYLLYLDANNVMQKEVFNSVDHEHTTINGLALVIVYGADVLIIPIARVISFRMEKGKRVRVIAQL